MKFDTDTASEIKFTSLAVRRISYAKGVFHIAWQFFTHLKGGFN